MCPISLIYILGMFFRSDQHPRVVHSKPCTTGLRIRLRNDYHPTSSSLHHRPSRVIPCQAFGRHFITSGSFSVGNRYPFCQCTWLTPALLLRGTPYLYTSPGTVTYRFASQISFSRVSCCGGSKTKIQSIRHRGTDIVLPSDNTVLAA